ncbi:MAG: 50S rRNA methyltransferase, partial [Chlamydiia bacterium]|nr:50S rRNA methyltransferase [Chlamydiia bacterium]
MSSSSSTTNKVFITCAKGFERQLSDELKDLGVQGIERASAGVYADGTFDTIYRANYGSRVASRVLLPLKSFRCRDAKELYAQAQTLDWVRYLRPDMTFAIDAHAVKNPAFTNSLYAAQVLKDALCDQLRDRFGERPSVNTKTPDVRLNLY